MIGPLIASPDPNTHRSASATTTASALRSRPLGPPPAQLLFSSSSSSPASAVPRWRSSFRHGVAPYAVGPSNALSRERGERGLPLERGTGSPSDAGLLPLPVGHSGSDGACSPPPLTGSFRLSLAEYVPPAEAPLLRAWRASRPSSASSQISSAAASTLSSVTAVTGADDDAFDSCVSAAFATSFLADHRVRHYCTKVMLHSHAFVIVGRYGRETTTAFYTRSKKLWECMPLGQVRVFRAAAPPLSSLLGRHPLPPSVPPALYAADTGCASPVSAMDEDGLYQSSPTRADGRASTGALPAAFTLANGSFDSGVLRPSASAAHLLRTPEGPPLASASGLRKFTCAEDGAAARAAFAVPKEVVVSAHAVERIDGPSGILSAFEVDGVPFWLVGSRERHLVVHMDVNEDDIAAYDPSSPARSYADGDTLRSPVGVVPSSAPRSDAGPFHSGHREKVRLAQDFARLWRQQLQRHSGQAAAALHTAICAGGYTLCCAAVLLGAEGLVDYFTEAEEQDEAEEQEQDEEEGGLLFEGYRSDVPDPTHVEGYLRFFAITRDAPSASAGLCLPVPEAMAFFEAHGLPHPEVSPSVRLGSEALEALEEGYARRLHCAGAVFYGANRTGRVVRMWKSASVPYQLERAAQEWIATQRVCGKEFEARLLKKISGLPKRCRAAGRRWSEARLRPLTAFSSWLFRTQQLTVSSDAVAVRRLRGEWITRQRRCAASQGGGEDAPDPEEGEEAEEGLPQAFDMTAFATPSSAADADDSPCSGTSSSSSGSCSASSTPATGSPAVGPHTAPVLSLSPRRNQRPPAELVLMTGPQGCGKSSLARSLVALLMQCGQSPCWLNQDELGSRGLFLAALRRVEQAGRHTHIIVDKMHLSAASRRDYAAGGSGNPTGLPVALLVGWSHPAGPAALAQVCCDRVRSRCANHRSFRASVSAGSDVDEEEEEEVGGAAERDQGKADACNNSTTQRLSGSDSNSEAAPSASRRRGGKRKTKGKPSQPVNNSIHHRNNNVGASSSAGGGGGGGGVPWASHIRDVVARSVAAYDAQEAPAGWVLLDVSLHADLQLAAVWRHLMRRSSALLRPLEELDTKEAGRLAAAYEDLIAHYPDPPLQAVLEATSPEKLLALVPAELQAMMGGAKKKIACVPCRVPVHSFTADPNPVAVVHYVDRDGHEIELELRRVIADSYATIVEAYPAAPVLAKNGSAASPRPPPPATSTTTAALELCPATPLFIPIARSKKGSGSRYPRDLYQRAVAAVRPDPFCRVVELPNGTRGGFRLKVLTSETM